MTDFNDLLSQAKKMQEKMKETQENLKKIEVEGVSGGNAVKIIMNGDGELKKITLDEKLLKESIEYANSIGSFSPIALKAMKKNIKVSVIQQPPVYLNLKASIERAVSLIDQSAKEGSELVVFPETWFPGYPEFVWRLKPGTDMKKTDELFKISQANSVDLKKNQMKPIQEAARKNELVIVAGHQEIDSEISGSTLYNSCIIIDADGKILNNHRKLMPTNPERMVWGFGDASGLNVVETAVGRIGALLCWENYMPLARYAIYSQNIDIYVAPTWDEGKTWLATMQHIAKEGGCWVISLSLIHI